ILESPRYNEIAKTFVSANRRHGLYFLRMKELGRSRPRLDVVEEIKETVRRHGFVADYVGGVYVLQGHMAQQVTSSLITGLARLLLLFFVVAWITSRSTRVSLALTASIGIVPSIILGLFGYLGLPLDVIAAPAVNVAVSMGVDAMIHMIQRRRALQEKGLGEAGVWLNVQRQLWQPIVTTGLVVSTGFGVFLLSQFPPTQRFGLIIILGVVLSCATALFLLPAAALLLRRSPRPAPHAP
ncbi:MAG: MMPL family transporter, partial [Deltaproteobacteria bacterium]